MRPDQGVGEVVGAGGHRGGDGLGGTRVVTVAGGRFATGHLGGLTQIVPFEMVDAALADTAAVAAAAPVALAGGGLRPARGGLFTEIGWSQVWARLCTGLDGLAPVTPSASALAAARTRAATGLTERRCL